MPPSFKIALLSLKALRANFTEIVYEIVCSKSLVGFEWSLKTLNYLD